MLQDSGQLARRGGHGGAGELECSFCGKHQKQLRILIAAAPDACICDGCVDRVRTVLAAPGSTVSTPLAAIRRVSDEGRDVCCSFCGKDHHGVEAMAAAADTRICSECLDLCVEVVADCPA